jgi:hypothetical protein
MMLDGAYSTFPAQFVDGKEEVSSWEMHIVRMASVVGLA